MARERAIGAGLRQTLESVRFGAGAASGAARTSSTSARRPGMQLVARVRMFDRELRSDVAVATPAITARWRRVIWRSVQDES